MLRATLGFMMMSFFLLGCATQKDAGEEEQKTRSVGRLTPQDEQPLDWCVYTTLQTCPPENIAFGDTICVGCTDPAKNCPDLQFLKIVDAQGKQVCLLRVRRVAPNCRDCPAGGHKYVWR